MLQRYSRPQMAALWTAKSRFDYLLQVEKAVAAAQAQYRLIPRKAAADIQKKAKFDLERIYEIEKETKHDVIAFVTATAEKIGESGRYLHYAMTSSDVLDTALSIQAKEAYLLLEKSILSYEKSLTKLIRKHKKTLTAGRTHGMHAEPTTFGFKMAGFWAETKRNEKRLAEAMKDFMIAKLSGAVGTYSAQSMEVEKNVAKRLGLQVETLATQVIPRDRHAQLLHSLSLFAAGIERLAIELRHLQRTEVGEVVEGFTPGQKGSSAMPHKKNPISAENLSGLSRMMRSYAQVAQENVALWHERDISHSSTERMILADAFILLDYMLTRMTTLLNGLYVDADRMKKNMNLSQGNLFSSHVLLALVEKGLSREEAYEIVQKLAHSLKPEQNLQEAVTKDARVKKLLKSQEIQNIFQGKTHLEAILKKLKSLGF